MRLGEFVHPLVQLRLADNEDALYRVSRISRYLSFGGEYDSDALPPAILGAAWSVLSRRLDGGGWEQELDRFSAGRLLSNLAINLGTSPRYGVYVSIIFARFIAGGEIFRPGCDLNFHVALLSQLQLCLGAGFLDPKADAAGIKAFIDWCRAEEPEFLAPGLSD